MTYANYKVMKMNKNIKLTNSALGISNESKELIESKITKKGNNAGVGLKDRP